MAPLSNSEPSTTRHGPKLNIHLVNIDVPTNVQNALRKRFEMIRDEIIKRSPQKQAQKDIIYINNREMRPVDVVLRMNKKPDVALFGADFGAAQPKNPYPSITVARNRFLEDQRIAKYRRAFQLRQLEESITVLVGDVKATLQKVVHHGFEIKIKVQPPEKNLSELDLLETLLKNDEQAQTLVWETDTEEFIIDTEEGLKEFFSVYSLLKIHSVEFLGMMFRAFIDLKEEESNFVIQNQVFNHTFLKIWNIEAAYRNAVYLKDVREFMFLSRFEAVLVVLPPSIVYLLKNLLLVDKQAVVHVFEDMSHLLQNVEDLKQYRFRSVIALSEDKDAFQSFSFSAQAYVFCIDELIAWELLEKILKVDVDISDPEKFSYLSKSIRATIEDIPNQYPESLKKYIPKSLVGFLNHSYGVVERCAYSVLKGELEVGVIKDLDSCFDEFSNLQAEYAEKMAQVVKEVNAVKTPINKALESIQQLMAQLKFLESEIEKLSSLQEEGGSSQTVVSNANLEKQEHQLRIVAKTQYDIAADLGGFIRDALRRNFHVFDRAPITNVPQAFLNMSRNIFNFTEEEWSRLLWKKIYYISNYEHVHRLMSTLMKAEGIPDEGLIHVFFPNDPKLTAKMNMEKLDWIFYDLSVTPETALRYDAIGRSRYSNDQMNEVLTRTENLKTQILKNIDTAKNDLALKDIEKKNLEEKLEEYTEEYVTVKDELGKISKKHHNRLLKYREVTLHATQFRQFHDSTLQRLNIIFEGIQKMSWALEHENQSEKLDNQAILRNLATIGEVFSQFYKSLVSIKFILQTLETFSKVIQTFRYKAALYSVENAKLGKKMKSPVKNVMVIRDASHYANNFLENLLPILMAHFRIAQENFKLAFFDNYESFLNRGYNYYVLVANNADDPHLSHLRKMIQKILDHIPGVLIFVVYSYPHYLIETSEMEDHQEFFQNLYYIRSKAMIFDANRIAPSNRLQISSIYLYSLY